MLKRKYKIEYTLIDTDPEEMDLEEMKSDATASLEASGFIVEGEVKVEKIEE